MSHSGATRFCSSQQKLRCNEYSAVRNQTNETNGVLSADKNEFLMNSRNIGLTSITFLVICIATSLDCFRFIQYSMHFRFV